jgi:hypothetical protein
MIKGSRLVLNMSTSVQTKAAEAHLTEGQFLLEQQMFNIEYSLICIAGTRRPTVSERRRNLDPWQT